MGFITELKRRNVFRVGVAYLVLGWVVVEVTATVSPALNFPEWMLSAVTWFGIIGFPFALLFAWAFELTPEGLKRDHQVDRTDSIAHETGRKVDFAIIGLLAVALAFVVIDNYVLQSEFEDLATPIEAVPAPEDATQAYDSIAVLPFDNMSSDPEQEFFSDGIAEELLNALARLRNLKVAARTSSFTFRDKDKNIREIGQALNVATVLEGSLRKSGNRLRITAQLIDVETGFHLWSETYDRELTDVFAVQDDITAQIMSALKVHLEAGETNRVTTTTSTKAYEAYLKGRQGLHRRNLESIQKAQVSFEQATALDPEFALAWAGLAQAIHLQSETAYGDFLLEDVVRRVDTLTNRALALAPDLGEAHAVRGLSYLDQWRYEDALIALDRAIESDPGNAEFHLWRANALASVSRFKDSREALDRAYQLDPLHPAILFNRVFFACRLGWEPVTESLFETLALYPERLAIARSHCHVTKGEFASAFELAADEQRGDERQQGLLRSELKDCETPWLASLEPEEDAFIQASLCLEDAAAMAAYEILSAQQKRDLVVRDFLSILQLRLGKYGESLATLHLYSNSQPSDLGEWLNSGSNLNLNRVLALQRLGEIDEATSILATEQRVLTQAKNDGMRRGYHFIQAKIHLLSGEYEAGVQELDVAFRNFEASWMVRKDPVLLELVGKEKLAEMTKWLDEHIDAERAKLGWPAADF